MRRVGIVFALAALLLAGCGGGDNSSRSGASPGATSQVQGSTENKLPDGFPKEVPLPPYEKVVYSAKVQDSTIVFFDSKSSSKEIRDWVVAELPKRGWHLLTCTTAPVSPEPVDLIVASKDDELLSFAIGFIEPTQKQLQFEGRFSYYVTLLKAQQAPPPASPQNC